MLSQISAIAFVPLGVGWCALQTPTGEPDHDLRDQLLGAQYRQSIAEKRSRIGELNAAGPHVLVEAIEDETNPHLLTVMRAFAGRFDADLDVSR